MPVTLGVRVYHSIQLVCKGHQWVIHPRRLKDAALQLGLTLNFQGITNYDVKLTASSATFLSVDNVNDFVNKLHILHQSTDGL